MNKTLKIAVDRQLCTANGLCAHLASDVFELDANRLAYTLVDEAADSEVLREAVESCPVAAISLVDKETGEELYP